MYSTLKEPDYTGQQSQHVSVKQEITSLSSSPAITSQTNYPSQYVPLIKQENKYDEALYGAYNEPSSYSSQSQLPVHFKQEAIAPSETHVLSSQLSDAMEFSQATFLSYPASQMCDFKTSVPANVPKYSHIPSVNPSAAPIHPTVSVNSSRMLDRSETYDINMRLSEIRKLYSLNPLASQLLDIETRLAHKLMELDYGNKVTHIYNPVDYAYKPHMEYYRKFCNTSAQVLLVGMNPGPRGMAQTGVPFGEVNTVSKWMMINEEVGTPRSTHEKRPVTGFQCPLSEVSGSRLWSFFRENFDTPSQLFDRCFIYNYCPLSFIVASGKNFTPSELPASARRPLQSLCDEALAQSIRLFPECHSLVGIGRFSEEGIRRACQVARLPHRQYYLLHPSPQNPTANQNWRDYAQKCFQDVGLLSRTPNSSQSAPSC